MSSFLRFIMLITGSVIFVFSTLFITSSQVNEEQDRVLDARSFRNEPVKITSVRTTKRMIRVGEKFKDINDWFRGLTIKIKNTSDKPINYVSAVVLFVRPKEQKDAGRPAFGEPLFYGVSPVDLKRSTSSTPVPSIPPGESIELGLPEGYFEEYKALLKKLEFPDVISRIEISVQEVGFEDGSLWSGGDSWQTDPNTKQYIPSHKTNSNFF